MLIPGRESDRFSKLFMYLYATPLATDSEQHGFNHLQSWPGSKLNLHLDHVAWKKLFNYLQGNKRQLHFTAVCRHLLYSFEQRKNRLWRSGYIKEREKSSANSEVFPTMFSSRAPLVPVLQLSLLQQNIYQLRMGYCWNFNQSQNLKFASFYS